MIGPEEETGTTVGKEEVVFISGSDVCVCVFMVFYRAAVKKQIKIIIILTYFPRDI